MKRDQRDPKAMGEVILSSLERLRSEGETVAASEAANRLEYLHEAGRVRIPDFSDRRSKQAL